MNDTALPPDIEHGHVGFNEQITLDGRTVDDRAYGTRIRFLLAWFTSGWLYPAAESRALNRAGANVSFGEFPTDIGRDAILLDEHAGLSV